MEVIAADKHKLSMEGLLKLEEKMQRIEGGLDRDLRELKDKMESYSRGAELKREIKVIAADKHKLSIEGLLKLEEKMQRIEGGLDQDSRELKDKMESYSRGAESNGRQLEELLESKQGLLMQHEKLITQYRLHKEQGEHELSKLLRSLIRDGEMANEETSAKILVLQEERDTLRTHLDTAERQQVETLTAQVEEAQAKVENLLKELEVSHKEIESEKEMQNILRGRYNELKQNFDTTSQKLFNAEGDLKRTRNSLHEKEAINSKLEEERGGLLRQLDEKNDKIGKLDEKLKEQQKMIEMIGRITAQRNS